MFYVWSWIGINCELISDTSPMSSRNFPASFWNSNYHSHHSTSQVYHPDTMYHHHGTAAGNPADPWQTHYQQYTAAAAHHHHRSAKNINSNIRISVVFDTYSTPSLKKKKKTGPQKAYVRADTVFRIENRHFYHLVRFRGIPARLRYIVCVYRNNNPRAIHRPLIKLIISNLKKEKKNRMSCAIRLCDN